MRQLAEAVNKIEQRTQRQPTAEEIAQEMGVSVEEHLKICQQLSVYNVVSLDATAGIDSLPGDESENPDQIVQKEQMIAKIKTIFICFNTTRTTRLSLYYIEEIYI